ncbi:MAG: FAD-dependent monooxygenase, partial [Bacteroidales bacterium]|nr:FAD-dependent monooxygenase [Bacteroidales bacterium]
MGIKTISIKLPTDFSNEILEQKISKMLNIKNFSFNIESKSLDARNKKNIFWLVKVLVDSPEIKGNDAPELEELHIPFRKRNKKIVVVGSGPAGFFNAFVLQKAGFEVTLIERGSEVKQRGADILH